MTRARGVADYGYYPPVNNNILINPSFTVKQRGDAVDHNNTSYGPDRWGIRGLGEVGGTMSQSTTFVDPTTGVNKLLVKHLSATSFAYVYQNIEAVNIQGMYSKEMTFSFSYSDVGGSGIPKVSAGSWDSSGSYIDLYNAIPTSLGDNRWTCTFTLSTDDGTIPDPSESGMQVAIYPNEKNNAPNEWYVWETKLEVGSVVTPFIARQYGEELSLCQRYFYKYLEADVGSAQVVAVAPDGDNGNNFPVKVPLPQILRAQGKATIGTLRLIINGQNSSTYTLGSSMATTNELSLYIKGTTAVYANSVLVVIYEWSVDAEL